MGEDTRQTRVGSLLGEHTSQALGNISCMLYDELTVVFLPMDEVFPS